MNLDSTSLPLSPIFRPFNPNGDVKVYLRNLPHWRQPGATYFVTFRQAETETEASRHRFWQYESYDRIIRDVEELAAFRRYIVRNPEAAGMKASESLYFAADWLDPFAPMTA